MGLNPLMPDLYIGNGRPNAVAYHHHHQNIMKITKITIVITGPYPARLRVDRQATVVVGTFGVFLNASSLALISEELNATKRQTGPSVQEMQFSLISFSENLCLRKC